MHVEIVLVKCLWLTSCDYASGPAGLLSMKLIKCEVYLLFFTTQYLTNTLGIFFEIWRYNYCNTRLNSIYWNYLHPYIAATKSLMYLNKINGNAPISVLKNSKTENVWKDQSKPSSIKLKFNTIGKTFQKISKQVILRSTQDRFCRSKDEAKFGKIFRKT